VAACVRLATRVAPSPYTISYEYMSRIATFFFAYVVTSSILVVILSSPSPASTSSSSLPAATLEMMSSPSDPTGSSSSSSSQKQQRQQQREIRDGGGRNNAAKASPSTAAPTSPVAAIVGYVSGEYPASLEGTNGTLFAGSNALHFSGSFFLFQKEKTIAWEDVRRVDKTDHGIDVVVLNTSANSSGGGDNSGVKNATASAGNSSGGDATTTTVYRFGNIHHPERVWAVMIGLHNDALVGKRGRRHSTVVPLGGMKRVISDPLLSYDTPLDDDDDEEDGVAIMERGSDGGDESSAPPKLEQASTARTDNSKKKFSATSSLLSGSSTDSFVVSTASIDSSSVEKSAGKLRLQPISCAFEGVKGKLYAGADALYFYGKRYWWEKTEVLVHWSSIRQIKLLAARKDEDGDGDGDDANSNGSSAPDDSNTVIIGICLKTKDEGDFQFIRMDNADQVWSSLVALHGENSSATAAERRQSRVIRRLNSDPMLASHTDMDFDDGAVHLDMASTVPDKAASMEFISTTSSGKEKKPSLVPSEAPTSPPSEDGQDDGDDEAEWKALTENADEYSKLIVDEHQLECNLDQFYALFIKDDAEFPMAKFLESGGDFNLSSSPWEKDGRKSKRIVRYTHPVNAPLAPPEADARKEQEFRRFGNHGMCLWTKTFVDGVPMADCFYVADRIRVVPKGDDKVSVFMEFEITFIKSTMFRGVISKTTSSGFETLFENYAKYMSQAVGGAEAAAKVEVRKEPAKAPPTAPTIFQSLQQHATIPVLAMVVAMQFWMLLELRDIKASLRDLADARNYDMRSSFD